MAQIILPEGAAPSTPATGYSVIYPKADGLWYSKDDAGVEYVLSGAQTTGYPTVTSSASPDIFAAAGATISINNSTPVTTTDFTDCTTAQVGSEKRVIPAQAWTVTASSNMTVNGFTSGNFVLQANSIFTVLAKSTTTFSIEGTIKDEITLTLSGSTGNPTTPVTATAYRTCKPEKMLDVTVVFSNVDTTGATGNLQITGLSHAALYKSLIGSCAAQGFGTTVMTNMVDTSTTVISFIDILTLANIPIVAGAGRYVWSSISYVGS